VGVIGADVLFCKSVKNAGLMACAFSESYSVLVPIQSWQNSSMARQALSPEKFLQREQAFLQETLRQIRQSGLLSLHMAKVSRACGYATGTLYQHFVSKEDLLLALNTELSSTRMDFLKRAIAWQAPSRQRQLALTVADILFAKQNPEHFQLAQYVGSPVVWAAASEKRRNESIRKWQPMTTLVAGIVDDAVAAGELPASGRQGFEIILGPWMLAMGAHTLKHADGLMDQLGIQECYYTMLRHQQVLLNGLQWKPLVDSDNDDALKASIEHVITSVFPEIINKVKWG